MVISLYICEIPRNVDKADLEDLFKSMDGFIESRLKPTNDMRKIAFVDFSEEKQAIFALETLQGFKFSPEDRGLIIKVSDNSKGGMTQGKYKTQKKRDTFERRKRSRSRERSRSRSKSDSREKNNNNYSKRRGLENNNNTGSSNKYAQNTTSNQNGLNPLGSTLPLPSPGNPLAYPPHGNPPLLDLLSLLANANTTNKPYTLDSSSSQSDHFPNLIDCLQNLQTVQLLSSSMASQGESARLKASIFEQSINRYDEFFRHPVETRKNATSIVYVEGLPNDTSEREVAHLFRPFPGFKSVRLITREKNGQKSLICFADFELVLQSTLCINTLQGYRFDKSDLVGLHFSYGVSKHKDKK